MSELTINFLISCNKEGHYKLHWYASKAYIVIENMWIVLETIDSVWKGLRIDLLDKAIVNCIYWNKQKENIASNFYKVLLIENTSCTYFKVQFKHCILSKLRSLLVECVIATWQFWICFSQCLVLQPRVVCIILRFPHFATYPTLYWIVQRIFPVWVATAK